MIVTSSLPFQLDAQFHPRVSWESQPHHRRLESPNQPPFPLMQLDPALSLHSILSIQAENNADRQQAHALHREMPGY